MNKVTMKVEGMMCGMCEAHVCDAVRKVCGDASKVTASHTSGLVEILLEGQPDVARIKAGVKETGYKVLDVQVEAVVQEKKKKGFLFFKK